jgi:hypothetical protein
MSGRLLARESLPLRESGFEYCRAGSHARKLLESYSALGCSWPAFHAGLMRRFFEKAFKA